MSLVRGGASGAEGAVEAGWLVELDPFVEEGEPDPDEWTAMALQ